MSSSLRNIRGEMNLNPGLALPLMVQCGDAEKEAILNQYSWYIKELAKVNELNIGFSISKPQVAASSILGGMEIIVPLEGLMNFEEEKKRIEKELKKIEKDSIFLSKKLSNPNFVDKAPPEVIAKDRQKHKDLSEKQAKLQIHLRSIEQAIS